MLLIMTPKSKFEKWAVQPFFIPLTRGYSYVLRIFVPSIIPAALGGTKAPSRPVPCLETSAVAKFADPRRRTLATELAARGTSWCFRWRALKRQVCPRKLKYSARRTHLCDDQNLRCELLICGGDRVEILTSVSSTGNVSASSCKHSSNDMPSPVSSVKLTFCNRSLSCGFYIFSVSVLCGTASKELTSL